MKFDGISRAKHLVHLKWVFPRTKKVKINVKYIEKLFVVHLALIPNAK